MAGFVNAPGTASNGAGKRLCHWKGVVLHHLFAQLAVESSSFYNPGCSALACGEQGAMKAKPEGVRTTKAPPGGSGVTTSTWHALWELESDETYHWWKKVWRPWKTPVHHTGAVDNAPINGHLQCEFCSWVAQTWGMLHLCVPGLMLPDICCTAKSQRNDESMSPSDRIEISWDFNVYRVKLSLHGQRGSSGLRVTRALPHRWPVELNAKLLQAPDGRCIYPSS